jgi:hypothetical protein
MTVCMCLKEEEKNKESKEAILTRIRQAYMHARNNRVHSKTLYSILYV